MVGIAMALSPVQAGVREDSSEAVRIFACTGEKRPGFAAVGYGYHADAAKLELAKLDRANKKSVSRATCDELKIQLIHPLLLHAKRFGPAALVRTFELLETVARASRQPIEARLQTINSFFNSRIEYKSDMDHWKLVERWSSPQETLDDGQGDCEDYAIAKYFALVATGISETNLRIVITYALFERRWMSHAVLAYFPGPNGQPNVDASPLILDNLSDDILPVNQRRDMRPSLVSMDTRTTWKGLGWVSYGDRIVGPWRNVLEKADLEGWWPLQR